MAKKAIYIGQKDTYALTMQNFWENKEWEASDLHLNKIKQMPFQRKFPFIPQKSGLYIIRGPRQIGKSSWLKTILSHYATKEKCFYLSCENVSDNKELAEILKSIRNCKIVLLDEISFVKNWDRAIKHEIDSGFTNILAITGSHAHDLKRGSDRLPGRFDNGGEFYLLPMLFDEFCESRFQAGWSSKDRVKELEAYFRVGGFPIAVAEGGPSGNYPTKSMETYWKWLSGDIVNLGKQENFLKEIMIQLFICSQTPISFQTLAKKTSIASHSTVQEYISVLESCFALRQLLSINIDTGSFHFKKNRKFYFSDPILFWIACQFAGEDYHENFYDKISEIVANEFLSRNNPRFGYFSNKKGEIDFISPRKWAVEVKWAEFASNLSKNYLNLSLLNKKVWTKNNFFM